MDPDRPTKKRRGSDISTGSMETIDYNATRQNVVDEAGRPMPPPESVDILILDDEWDSFMEQWVAEHPTPSPSPEEEAEDEDHEEDDDDDDEHVREAGELPNDVLEFGDQDFVPSASDVEDEAAVALPATPSPPDLLLRTSLSATCFCFVMDWEKRFGVVEAGLSRIEDGLKTLFSIRHVAPSDHTSQGTVSRSNKPPVNEADSTLAMLSEEIRRLREEFHGLKEEYTSSSGVNAYASAPDRSGTQPAEADKRRQTGPNDPPGIPTRRPESLMVEGLRLPPEFPPSMTTSATEERRFSLGLEDLGENMISNLAKFIADDEFAGRVSVVPADLGVDWTELAKRIDPPRGHDHYTVKHAPALKHNGVSRLLVSQHKKLKLLDFDEPAEEPPADIEGYLQRLIDTPPKQPIPYYVGPLPASPLDSLFPSGLELSQLGPVSGANTLYGHMGERDSGTAFHCEDVKFRSFNVTVFGVKL
ncbi:hypothetical protein B0T22DRAFT_480440 [Podospora appendiculata]|uniref:Uncharacterized protein n=1 Tax=Podospora appendiculata TaxID=314037 RepID=A0AAE0XB67_9PEZI|nr:hypothetical protein B0T22DRAFT_480440 [Podospora appendiculata]